MTSRKKIFTILVLSLGFAALCIGGVACQKKAAEAEAAEAAPVKPTNEYEGPVKVAVGKYMYVPAAQGFDIVLQGGDATAFLNKDVKVRGELLVDKPSIYRADAVEVKDASGTYASAFTRTEEPVLEDYLDAHSREAFTALVITNINKSEEWEGKGQVKVYGKLQKTNVTEGGNQKEVTYITLNDAKGKELGKIIVDNTTNYAQYYMNKLRLFDTFWFYLNIKESVDRKVRTRTKELFHADILFCGLF
jgi:hypothetical protein